MVNSIDTKSFQRELEHRFNFEIVEHLNLSVLMRHLYKVFEALRFFGFQLTWVPDGALDYRKKLSNHQILLSVIVHWLYATYFKTCLDKHVFAMFARVIADMLLMYVTLECCPLMTEMKGAGIPILKAVWTTMNNGNYYKNMMCSISCLSDCDLIKADLSSAHHLPNYK